MKNILYFIIVFILVNSGGGVHFSLGRNIFLLTLFFLSITYLILFNKKNTFNEYKNTIFVVFTFLLITILNYFVALPGQIITRYLYFFFSIVTVSLIIFTLPAKKFTKVFIQVLTVFEIHALISFGFSFFIQQPYLQDIVRGGGNQIYQTFHYIFFFKLDTNLVSAFGVNFIRNAGLFWEPGILQFYMNLLLFHQLFVRETSLSKILLTIFVILTTYSTSGFIIMTLILLYKFKSVLSIRRFPILFLFTIISVILLYPIINENIISKMQRVSGWVRIFDILQSIYIIKDYPIAGIGITLEVYEKLQLTYTSVFGFLMVDITGNTNSIFRMLIFFGVPLGSFFIYALYRQNVLLKQNRKFIFLILLIFLSSQPLIFNPFYLFLISNGIINILMNPIPNIQPTKKDLYNGSLQ